MADSKKYGRTANLFDKSNGSYNAYVDDAGTWRYVDTAKSVKILCSANTTYTLSVPENLSVFRIYEISDALAEPPTQAAEIVRGGDIVRYTFTTASTTAAIIFQGSAGSFDEWFNGLMLNTGSTALPYQPYLDWLHSLRKLGTATDTITTLPANLYADGNNATVGLKGNMSQTSTPSPTTPIQPSECGERTGNLFDKDADYTVGETTNAYTLTGLLPNHSYTCSTNFTYPTKTTASIYFGGGSSSLNGVWSDLPRTKQTDSNGNIVLHIRWKEQAGAPDITEDVADGTIWIMVNEGSTALPYEPYGQYKIPILNSSQTTNVYLGEVETTRKIKKLVLDGTEGTWKKSSIYQGSFYNQLLDTPSLGIPILCSHAVYTPQITASTYVYGKCGIDGGAIVKVKNLNLFIGEASWSVSDFQQYLAHQYAAGTPVTVWYVLAEPTTGIVNEPLRKIGDYADTVSGITIPTIAGANTLSVDTTLQPSEVTVNYKGWHPVQSVHERESGAWD